MTNTEIVNQYKEALLDSMRNDLSRHQKKIFGSGSLPDGIHGYYKALEEMTQEYLISSFLKEHQEWKECCRDDESLKEYLLEYVSEFNFWRMKQIQNLNLWTSDSFHYLRENYPNSSKV